MSQGSVPMLRSYTGGAWRTGGGEGVALHDAVTGDPIARISSAGIDMAAPAGRAAVRRWAASGACCVTCSARRCRAARPRCPR